MSVWSRVMPPQGIGFLGTSVFSGTGDPLSEKWKEERWARFSDRHAQLNTFECALFALLGSYLYFSPVEPTVTFFNDHTGHCPPQGPDELDLAVLLCGSAGAPDWVEEILGSVRYPQQLQGENHELDVGYTLGVGWVRSRKVRGWVCLTKASGWVCLRLWLWAGFS